MKGVAGRVAIVSGAARGNGRAIAEALAREGARVALCDVLADGVRDAAAALEAEGLSAAGYPLDVADPAAAMNLAATVARDLGAAGILVNNAGIIRRSAIDEAGFPEDWDRALAVNATGAMNLIRAFLPQLRETRGVIVNIGSIMSVAAGPRLAAYAASKGALLQLTRALAQELAPDGVRVNAVGPGVIDTPMTESTRADPAALGRFMAHTPMRRTGRPEEVAGPVLFLASDLASYVTGVLLPVDGGYLAA